MSSAWIAALLVAVAIVLRAPFFFDSVIDWDESTYLLMGALANEGHVPYRDFWYANAPGLVLAFSLISALSSGSIVVARLIGAVIVAIIAFGVFAACRRVVLDSFQCVGAALITVAFIGLVPSGMAVMSEIVATLFLTWALAVAASPASNRVPNAFLLGVLLGLAALCRLNLAYPALAIGAVYVVRSFIESRQWIESLKRGSLVALGGLTPVLLAIGYFASRNALEDAWVGTVLAPLAYAGNQYTIPELLGRYVPILVRWPYVLLALPTLAFMMLLPVSLSRLESSQRWAAAYAVSAAAAIFYSMLVGGAGFAHYAMQIVPSLTLLLVLAMHGITGRNRAVERFAVVAIGLACLTPAVVHSAQKALAVEKAYVETRTLFDDDGHRAASWLQPRIRPGTTLYAFETHYVYWKLGLKPPTIHIHPSNISKPYLIRLTDGPGATPTQVLAKIFSTRPDYILNTVKPVWYLRDDRDALAYVAGQLEASYDLCVTLGPMQIFHRRESVQSGGCE
jgi:hypothetical protein